MKQDNHNGHDLDELLNRILKDDLPPETELKMRERLSVFRRTAESSRARHGAPGIRAMRLRSAFEAWLSRPPAFRKRALAYVSAAMLATGIVIHLGGYQSVLADSISLFKTSVSVAQQIRLANSMECDVTMPAAGAHVMIYHIRWARPGRTRVDVESPNGIQGTSWISRGNAANSGFTAGSPGSAAASVASIPEVARAFLSPLDLARKLDGDWQIQPEKNQHSRDKLVFVDRHDRAVVVVHFDGRSFLPISLSRRPPDTDGGGGAGAAVRFIWNQKVDPELMTPRRETGR